MKLKSVCFRVIGKVWNPKLQLPWRSSADAIQIICAHGVHLPESERIAPPPSSSVTAASLAANLKALARHHSVIPLHEAVGMLNGRLPWKERCAVLTFDDSVASTVDVALPILQRMNMTASVFISTDAINTRQTYWWLRLEHAWQRASCASARVLLPDDKPLELHRGNRESLQAAKARLKSAPASVRDAAIEAFENQLGARLTDPGSQYPYAALMTWENVTNLLRAGIDIGSHTVSHANLALLSKAEAKQELVDSKFEIERRTGVLCRHVCYPFGSFNETVEALAVEAGYEAATSTVSPGSNRSGQDLFALRRFPMPGLPWKLGYTLSGVPAALASLRSVKKISEPAVITS